MVCIMTRLNGAGRRLSVSVVTSDCEVPRVEKQYLRVKDSLPAFILRGFGAIRTDM